MQSEAPTAQPGSARKPFILRNNDEDVHGKQKRIIRVSSAGRLMPANDGQDLAVTAVNRPNDSPEKGQNELVLNSSSRSDESAVASQH